MADISFYSTGSYSTTAYLINLDPNWGAAPDNDSRFVDWYVNSSFYGTSYLLGSYPSYGYTSGGDITIRDLSPSTTYDVQARVYSPNKGLLATLYSSVTTSTIQVGFWSWHSNELNALQNNGSTLAITYTRWNELVDKINAVCLAANESWLNDYTTLSGAKASGSGTPLTALMFNSARYNIGSRVSTGIAEVSTGDIIYGWYFITLQDKLNQWIASL